MATLGTCVGPDFITDGRYGTDAVPRRQRPAHRSRPTALAIVPGRRWAVFLEPTIVMSWYRKSMIDRSPSMEYRTPLAEGQQ